MTRLTLWHRTPLARLPLIEVEGLRTRVDLSDRLGPLDVFDMVAPGRLARGRRVSGWVSRAHADTLRDVHGAGLVSYTVDPSKALAQPAALRLADPEAAWAAVRPLRDWLADVAGDVAALPVDLEVHQDVPVRAKLVTMLAPTLADADLGPHAPLVHAVGDSDRVAARLLMHLMLAHCDGDAAQPSFAAACALAWRGTPDDDDLARRVARADVDVVLETILAEHEAVAPAASSELLALLDTLRSDGEAAGIDLGDVMLERSDRTLTAIAAAA
jgi:hypothetical protein